MAAFNLTAQLQLQAPTNTSQVVSNIKKQLSGITANVQVKGDAGALAKINKQLQGVNKSADSSARSVGNLNRNLSEAARRFSVITVATGTMLALARAIKNAVGEAIAFERELIKISQVTGKTVSQLGGLTDEVTRLSVSLGASSKDLLNVSRVLAQAGFTAEKTKQALEILAQTSLGATFESIQDTTEGAIAVLRQFGDEARRVGGDIKFLTQTMDAINSVSKKFAVESGDLITVIRRVGGVFSAAGGEVNELIALFTSVRATTRESAETIATGLRTIFTRIQRTDTVDQLAELGIQLRDSQGQFVGAYEAVNRLSIGLSSLDPRDYRFSEIVESLGGFRQVGKVIPLIRQFTTAQDALNVAQAASGSVARDAATAQQSLQVQAQKVTQDFQALIRTLVDSSTFRSVAKGALAMASAFIKIVEAIEPLLPLITSLIALKIGSALAPGLGALTGMRPRGRSGGGRIHAFASGGFVPGTGNRDTVPAMLSPGEFVIRKSSVNKMGVGALEAMNNNRYATGGMQPNEVRSILGLKEGTDDYRAAAGTSGKAFAGRRNELLKKAQLIKARNRRAGAKSKYPGGAYETIPGQIGAFVLRPEKGADGGFKLSGKNNVEFDTPKGKAALMGGSSFSTYFPDRADLKENSRVSSLVTAGAQLGLKRGVQAIGTKVSDFLSVPGSLSVNKKGIKKGANAIATDMDGAVPTMEGFIFEGLIQGITGAKLAGEGANFDFPNVKGGSASKLEAMFAPSGGGGIKSLIKADAKRGLDAAKGRKEGSLAQKTIQDIKAGNLKGVRNIAKQKISTDKEINTAIKARSQGLGIKRAAGGKIDSVPALLTPGEYVVNKSSAQSIGYSNLNKMNQTGVQAFAAGGTVNTRRHAYGTTGTGGARTNLKTIDPLSQKLQSVVSALDPKSAVLLNRAMKDNAGQFNALVSELKGVDPANAEAALKAFSRGALKGEKDLVTLGTEAAGVVTTVDRLKSTINKTASQIKDDKNKLKNIKPGGLGPPPGPIPLNPQQRIKGGALQQSQDAAQAKGILGIGVGGSGDEAGDLDRAMAHYTNLIDSGVSHQKALNDVSLNLEKTDTKIEAIKKKLSAAIEKRIASVKKSTADAAKAFKKDPISASATAIKGVGKGVVKGVGKGIRDVGDKAKGAQGLARSAQSAVFFGAAIAATSIQMSSLGEVTKQAATETVAFGAALVAGGATAVDMLANLASVGKVAAAAEVAETTGSSLATTGDTVEAGASIAVSIPLLLVAVAVLGLILVLKYFSAQAKAQADALAKGRKESLERLGTGEGTASDVTSAKDSIDAEFALRRDSNALDPMPDSFNEGLGIAGATAAGALIGSFIPGIGTAVGALIGFGVGVYLATGYTEENAEASRRQTESIYGSIDAIEKLGSAGKAFDDAMSDLDKLPAATTEAGKKQRVEQELDLGNELGTEIQGSNVGAEFGKLAELAANAGKTIAQLSEDDFDKDDAQGAKDLAAFQTALQATTIGMEQLAKRTSAARQTLAKATALEVTGEFSFTELIAQGGLFAQSLKAAREAIRAETQGRIEKAKGDEKAAELSAEKAFEEGDPAALDKAMERVRNARKAAADARARGDKQDKQLVEATEAGVVAAKERFAADARAAAAAEALRKALLRTTQFMMALSDIKFDQEETAKALGNQAALQSGGDLNFSRTAPKGLEGDITMIKDLRQFNQEMMAAINDFPVGLRAEAKRQLAIVSMTSKLFSDGKDDVLKQFKVAPSGKFGKEQQKDVIRAAGLDPDKIDKDILAGMLDKIKDSIVGGISESEFEDIFGPMQAAGEVAQGVLQEMNDRRNQELDLYGKYLDNIQSKRDEQLQGIQKLIDVQQSNVELLAQARGVKIGIGAKQRGRTRSAQVALSGTGVRAGSVAGASQALRAAQQQREVIAQEIKDRKASGQSIKAKMALDKKLQDIIKKTTAELERLADQSDRASDIMAQIDEEKAKREVITGLITDFVVGGRDDRKAMINANAGVVNAIRTGTLQNQSPEQRAATVGLLDKLENIALPAAGGLTGKQVKQELVFRDAIRMGLDPEVARQLATATTKEQQLINALEKLTEQMEAAARAAAGRPAPGAGGAMPGMAGPWTGGYITSGGGVAYRAGGGSMFQPKGTDTVPAMLTPGEYVVKKSAVDRVGVGALSAINSGRHASGGLVQYRQAGGYIKSWHGDVLGQSEEQYNNSQAISAKEGKHTRQGQAPISAEMSQQILDNRKEWAAEQDAKRKDTQKRIEFEQTEEGKSMRNYVDKLGNTENEKQVIAKRGGLLSFQSTEGQNRFGGRGGEGLMGTFDSGTGITTPFMPPELQNMQRQQKEREAEKARLAALEAERKRKEDIEAVKGMQEEKQRAAEAGPAKFGSVEEAQAWLKKKKEAEKAKQDAKERANLERMWEISGASKEQGGRWIGLPTEVTGKPTTLGSAGGGPGLANTVSALMGGEGGKKEPKLVASLDKLTNQLKMASNTASLAASAAGGFAFGGLVQYRAGGGSIFQPKGTDTVPAMLTPGEFVIKKSSVDKIGRGNLAALNNGYARGGLVQYRAPGGAIVAGGTIESNGMMDSDQVKASFVLAANNIGLGKLLQIYKADGTDEMKAQVPNLGRLLKNEQLKVSQLTAPNVIASRVGLLKTYAEEQDFIEGVGNGRLLLRGPQRGWMPPTGANRGTDRWNKWDGGMSSYINSVKQITNRLMEIFPTATSVDRITASGSRVAGRVLEQGLGWNLGRYGKLSYGTNKLYHDAATVQTKIQSFGIWDAEARQKVIQFMKDKDIDLNATRILGGGELGLRTGVLGPGGFDIRPFTPERGDAARRRMGIGGRGQFQNMLDQLLGQGMIGFAQGGNVPGTDTVPAMLTPGEFVMNKAAVAQHGVGYMKSLNRGRIPGFNRGGVVGRGGVQYKQDGGGIAGGGGVLSIDPTRLQGVLDTFNINFSAMMDNIVVTFGSVGESLSKLSDTFGDLSMTHHFSGEIGMSVNISNKDAIIASVAEGLTPSIEGLIINTVDRKFNELKDGQ